MRERREKLKLFQEELNRAKKELEILDNSLESLKKKQKEAVNREISVCDKLDWNNTLAGFDFLSLDPVFVAEPQLPIKTAGGSSGVSPDNEGSQ